MLKNPELCFQHGKLESVWGLLRVLPYTKCNITCPTKALDVKNVAADLTFASITEQPYVSDKFETSQALNPLVPPTDHQSPPQNPEPLNPVTLDLNPRINLQAEGFYTKAI